MSKVENEFDGHTCPKTFYVYGEDGLTLKFLLERLDIVLDQLDKSNPSDCEVYYRPSFGRGIYYGEFDAIILTPQHAYLVESKWDRSSGLKKGLREEQTKRHDILMWLSERWKGKSDEDWNRFRIKFQEKFLLPLYFCRL